MLKKSLKKISFEDIWEKKVFQPKSVTGLCSSKDGLSYTVLEDKKRIVKYRFSNGKKISLLLDIEKLNLTDIDEIHAYKLSQDEDKIILSTNYKKLYRNSFYASYYVFDLKMQKLIAVSDKTHQRIAELSPDATKVAFTWQNNIYIKDIESQQEIQITSDGLINNIINGLPDWVYEEEFGNPAFLQWSNDNNQLAYIRSDESQVKEIEMNMFGDGYPEVYRYKYPRAGEKNALVSLHVYDLASQKTILVDTGQESDQYLSKFYWTKGYNELLVVRLNRVQNVADFILCNSNNGSSKVILSETDERYIEVFDGPIFIEDKKHFILMSEKSGWQHLYLYDLNGKLVNRITKGPWNVTAFKGYDDQTSTLYFESSKVSPLQRHLYSIKLDGTNMTKISSSRGVHRIEFSKKFRYFIDYYSAMKSVPSIILYDQAGKKIRVIEDNKKLSKTLKTYALAERKKFQFETSQGITLNGWIVEPLKMMKNKEYPLIMTVYGGPGSQTVTDSWLLSWEQIMVQKGYVVASVDNRGTGMRGAEFKKCTYQQLGNLETIDQIEAAKYLGSLPFIDAKRIGIFGWSYGGFMACNCIMRGAKVFKTAVAVAPVTHYKFYDSVYTERFMNLPQNNQAGYDDYSPMAFIDKLKNNFLLVHGIADDNVHFQNSTELMEKMIAAKKQFEVHFVPNKDHGIRGGHTSLHLFKRMMTFFLNNC